MTTTTPTAPAAGRRPHRLGTWPSVLVCAAAMMLAMVGFPRISEATSSSGDRAIFEPLAPARILDTRFGPSPLPVGTKLATGVTLDLAVTGNGGVAADATAVVINVTVTEASATSHLTVWPTGEAKPNASNLNFVAGQAVPNLVIVKLGAGGKISIANNTGQTHVIGDVNGYFRGHNFDDRYYTKAQIDAKLSALQITSSQIKDGEVKNADLADGSVTESKLAKQHLSVTFSVAVSVPAGVCKTIGSMANPTPGQAGDLLLFSAAGSHPDVTFPIQRMGSSSASIVACNGGSFSNAFDVGSKINAVVIDNG
jgi:hypothetical protein